MPQRAAQNLEEVLEQGEGPRTGGDQDFRGPYKVERNLAVQQYIRTIDSAIRLTTVK